MITILFISANPRDSDRPLEVEKERREIYRAIQSARYRDQFDLKNWDGVTVKDFRQILKELKPDILHISAHFTKSGEPVFLNEESLSNVMSTPEIIEPFEILRGKLKCVVLNGPSEPMALAISKYVDFVVGFSKVSDKQAIEFSRNFYGSLADGHSIGESFKIAIVSSELSENAKLRIREKVDAEKFFLIDSNQTSEKKYGIKYDSIEIFPDDPTQQDLLSRATLAEVLARRIEKMREQNRDASFLINLDGPWGSGKSSFLRLLKSELQRKKPTWLVVEFNAWQNQRIPSPWWSLIESIYRQTLEGLRKLSPFDYVKTVISETLWRAKFKRSRFFLFVTLILLLLGLVILFSGIDLSNIQGLSTAGKQFVDFVQKISGILAVVGSLISAILLLQSFLLPAAKTEPSELFKSFDDPMRRLSLHFGHYTKKTPFPIAVFIDDLDRCTERYTVEFLEGIQTIFREGRVVYVIAADRRWIQLAYEKAYESFGSIGEPARPLGHLFLAKVFQMSIPIPTLSSSLREKYLKTLLEGIPEKHSDQKEIVKKAEAEIQSLKDANSIVELAMKTDGDPVYVQTVRNLAIRKLEEPKQESETVFMLQKFHHLLESNPRAIKRLLNTFVIYRAMLIIQGIELDFEILVLWVILMMRWPILSEYISRHPDLVEHLSDVTNFQDIPEKLKLLLSNEDLINVVKGKDIGKILDAKAIRQIAQL